MKNKTAIEVFGIDHQIDKLVEECGELIQAAIKFKHNKDNPKCLVHFAEELADVLLTQSHFENHFGLSFSDLIYKTLQVKKQRLNKLISDTIIERNTIMKGGNDGC